MKLCTNLNFNSLTMIITSFHYVFPVRNSNHICVFVCVFLMRFVEVSRKPNGLRKVSIGRDYTVTIEDIVVNIIMLTLAYILHNPIPLITRFRT